MKLGSRCTILAAIIVLMVTSLGAVSAFVLIRNNESSRAITRLQIDQVTIVAEVGGPPVLGLRHQRMQVLDDRVQVEALEFLSVVERLGDPAALNAQCCYRA